MDFSSTSGRVVALVIGAIIGCAAPSTARADTITAKMTGVSLGSNVSFQVKDQNGNYQSGSGTVGIYNWMRTDGQTEPLDQLFTTFCIELTQHINIGSTYQYDLVNLNSAPRPGIGVYEIPDDPINPGMGASKADYIRELWGRYRGGVDTATKAAAFQLAIWEIVYDGPGSFNVTTGNFKVSSTTSSSTQAANWLTTLDATGPKANLAAITGTGIQDQVTAIPLPLAAWGGIALFGMLGAATLRRSRRNSSV